MCRENKCRMQRLEEIEEIFMERLTALEKEECSKRGLISYIMKIMRYEFDPQYKRKEGTIHIKELITDLFSDCPEMNNEWKDRLSKNP